MGGTQASKHLEREYIERVKAQQAQAQGNIHMAQKHVRKADEQSLKADQAHWRSFQQGKTQEPYVMHAVPPQVNSQIQVLPKQAPSPPPQVIIQQQPAQVIRVPPAQQLLPPPVTTAYTAPLALPAPPTPYTGAPAMLTSAPQFVEYQTSTTSYVPVQQQVEPLPVVYESAPQYKQLPPVYQQTSPMPQQLPAEYIVTTMPAAGQTTQYTTLMTSPTQNIATTGQTWGQTSYGPVYPAGEVVYMN